LKRQHVFAIASISFLCDATLIIIGAGGFGALIVKVPVLTAAATWGGAAFLLFTAGLRSNRLLPAALAVDNADIQPNSLRGGVLATLALSLLNPHVYLDTVVLVGGLATQYPAHAFTLARS